MANSLFNRFGNVQQRGFQQNTSNNILNQFFQVKNNPGMILDILLQNGKINQMQYNELQPYKNNPEQIIRYLANNSKTASSEINSIMSKMSK